MSWLSGIVDFGKSLLTGNSIGSTLLKTIVTGYALKKLSSNVLKANEPDANPNIDGGVRLQVPPASDEKIPVLYGEAYFGGIITEAQMTADNKTMYYVLTLCEKTGTKLSDSTASTFTFKNIYWNNQRIVFRTTGSTAGQLLDYTVDSSGTIDRTLSGLVTVYCYRGNSTTPTLPTGYSNPTLPNAYAVVPNWTSNHTMNDLIFAVVKIDYNRDKNLTQLGNILFQIENDMKKPGDVLYDYMTNTRYGAGIPAENIYA